MAVTQGLSAVLQAIEGDFEERLLGYHKSRREGLVTLAAVMLETRSANLMELAAYAGEIFARLAAQGQTIVLMLDQSKVNDFNEVLMVSVRIARFRWPGGCGGRGAISALRRKKRC